MPKLPVALGDVVEERGVWLQPVRLLEIVQSLLVLGQVKMPRPGLEVLPRAHLVLDR
jgi:hypothetical protein